MLYVSLKKVAKLFKTLTMKNQTCKCIGDNEYFWPRKVKEAIWIKKTKPTLNRDSDIFIVTNLCTSNFKTAASQQLTRLEKVHRSGRKLASPKNKVGRSFNYYMIQLPQPMKVFCIM